MLGRGTLSSGRFDWFMPEYGLSHEHPGIVPKVASLVQQYSSVINENPHPIGRFSQNESSSRFATAQSSFFAIPSGYSAILEWASGRGQCVGVDPMAAVSRPPL
ncbi:hypothetical protein AFLA_005266 [Aspergillus flavus NRRL3357]|nr:hypothetical protein AFLA_005266 [Aspergillus flavus NRRL3357]